MVNNRVRVVSTTDNVHSVYLKHPSKLALKHEKVNINDVKPLGVNADTCELIGMNLDDEGFYSVWIDNLLYSMDVKTYEFCYGQGMDFSQTVKIDKLHRLQNAIYFLTSKMLTYEQD